jgi:hypothetical protein
VLSRPWLDCTSSRPVFSSMKQPAHGPELSGVSRAPNASYTGLHRQTPQMWAVEWRGDAVLKAQKLWLPAAGSPPVPYVFLASCTAQRWPIMAACWSPRQPDMGTPCSGPSTATVLR